MTSGMSILSDADSDYMAQLEIERLEAEKKKKKESKPIVGYSNLIKRDFFNLDGPKREPMALVQTSQHIPLA